jgi:hypothetical protein
MWARWIRKIRRRPERVALASLVVALVLSLVGTFVVQRLSVAVTVERALRNAQEAEDREDFSAARESLEPAIRSRPEDAQVVRVRERLDRRWDALLRLKQAQGRMQEYLATKAESKRLAEEIERIRVETWDSIPKKVPLWKKMKARSDIARMQMSLAAAIVAQLMDARGRDPESAKIGEALLGFLVERYRDEPTDALREEIVRLDSASRYRSELFPEPPTGRLMLRTDPEGAIVRARCVQENEEGRWIAGADSLLKQGKTPWQIDLQEGPYLIENLDCFHRNLGFLCSIFFIFKSQYAFRIASSRIENSLV